MRGELVGEAFAVDRQRGLGGGVGQCRVVQRHFALDRRHVDDRSCAGVDHRGDESAIEAYRPQEIELQRPAPQLRGEHREPARRGGPTASDVDDDVHASVLGDLLDHGGGPFGSCDVGSDELIRRQLLGSCRPVAVTYAPAMRKRALIAAPVPLVPPLIRARLPARSRTVCVGEGVLMAR